MTISLDLSGKILLSNVTTIRDEINRLRVKHGMASYSFAASNEFTRSADLTDIKTAITQFNSTNESHFPSTQDVSTITPIAVADLIKSATFSAIVTKLNEVDAICHNFSNQSNHSVNSNYSDKSVQSVQSVQSVNTVNSVNTDNTVHSVQTVHTYDSNFTDQTGGC